jgi:hypothetical protein
MLIIGSGLSGLLVGNILRKKNPIILEKQKELPNNHKALLRFRSDKVSKATGIPFKRVTVSKACFYKNSMHSVTNLQMSNEYSYKVTGNYEGRSIMNLETSERYIAPENLIEQMANGLNIMYNFNILKNKLDIRNENETIISTMPMIELMKLLDWKDIPNFATKPIWTFTADIKVKCDLYQTIYFPEYSYPYYRISITGKKLIVECMQEVGLDIFNLKFILEKFFRIESEIENFKKHYQEFGKLVETDKKTCKKFISWATKEHNIYSLGRWGLHRQILMDDVVDDIFVINHLIETGNYGVMKR